MKTTYAALVKYLREEQKLSQEAVAKQIGVSRASYVAVEKGTKELTLKEADALTKLFGITLEELLRNVVPNQEKYMQMMRAFLRTAKARNVTLKKTKLAKLLYLSDFSWYYLHKESMSGVAYRNTEFGPIADMYFRLLDEMEQTGVINIRQVFRDDYHMYELEETRASSKTALSQLSKKEHAHIQKVWKQWEKASTAEIVKFTEVHLPQTQSRLGQIISYDLILKEAVHNIF
jgi:DNA-binding XRE family transcriptional regulator/uncharacterized phage-associated protein